MTARRLFPHPPRPGIAWQTAPYVADDDTDQPFVAAQTRLTLATTRLVDHKRRRHEGVLDASTRIPLRAVGKLRRHAPDHLPALAVVGVLLGLTLTACYPSINGKSCDLGFALGGKPRITGTSILGQVGIICDIPPNRHSLRVTLERRTSEGRWNERASVREASIPGNGAHPLIVQVLTHCEAGLWRVSADVSGSLHGQDFKFSDSSTERVVTKNECR